MHPALCSGPGVPLYPSCRCFFGSTALAGMEQEKPAHTEPAAGLFLSLGSLRPVQIPTHFLTSKEIIAAVSNSPHLLISLFLSALTPKPLLLFFFPPRVHKHLLLLSPPCKPLLSGGFLRPAPPFPTRARVVCICAAGWRQPGAELLSPAALGEAFPPWVLQSSTRSR